MKSIDVYTKEELVEAKEKGYEEIIVHGKLVEKLISAKKITKLSKKSLWILGIALGSGAALTPVTGGLSLAAAAPVAAITGLEIATIIGVSFLGTGLIMALSKDYEEINFQVGDNKLCLRKKQK